MPYPSKVVVDGKTLTEVEEFSINLKCETTGRGSWEKRTGAAEVKIKRRSRNLPSSHFFAKATNGDGKNSIISGEIDLENAQHKPTYIIKMNSAYVSGWSFDQPEDDGDLMEEITLTVGDLKFETPGSGKSTTFVIPTFHKK